jgi:hypothetical protein
VSDELAVNNIEYIDGIEVVLLESTAIVGFYLCWCMTTQHIIASQIREERKIRSDG